MDGKWLGFPYVIGVSAGALCGANYVSRQIGRTAHINITYSDDPAYISWRNRLRHGGLFHIPYLFDDESGRWDPFDYDTYRQSPCRFLVGVTCCQTGKALYFENPQDEHMRRALTASSSMPLLSRIIETEFGPCLDGGIAQPIPYERALADGFTKVVVVRTQHAAYRKQPDTAALRALYGAFYGRRQAFRQALLDRPSLYNRQVEELLRMEKQGDALVLHPQTPVSFSRLERDKDKLRALYQQGRREAEAALPRLRAFLQA